MRTGHGDDNGQVTDPQVTHTVDSGEGPDRVLRGNLLRNTAHLGLGRRMARIAEGVDIGTSVVVAHGADEERGAARGVVTDSREHLVEGERGLADRQQTDGVLRRLLTGMIVGACHAAIVPHAPDDAK